jgi:hypothetical protein
MVTTLGWFYLIGGTILFFFWAYGIVSASERARPRARASERRPSANCTEASDDSGSTFGSETERSGKFTSRKLDTPEKGKT